MHSQGNHLIDTFFFWTTFRNSRQWLCCYTFAHPHMIKLSSTIACMPQAVNTLSLTLYTHKLSLTHIYSHSHTFTVTHTQTHTNTKTNGWLPIWEHWKIATTFGWIAARLVFFSFFPSKIVFMEFSDPNVFQSSCVTHVWFNSAIFCNKKTSLTETIVWRRRNVEIRLRTKLNFKIHFGENKKIRRQKK